MSGNLSITHSSGLFLHTEYLLKNLEGDVEIPQWDEVAKKLSIESHENPSSELSLAFQEISTSYDFIDQEEVPLHLLGTLFIAFYRTYTLISRPSLRDAGVQIGSSLEEMLALLALNHCPTLLFKAVKQWILNYETEGFSSELAFLIKDL